MGAQGAEKNGGSRPGQYMKRMAGNLAWPGDWCAGGSLEVLRGKGEGRGSGYHAFGLIATALSKNISVFQSSSLKVVPISPNAS
jgi:hypothetical protein